MGWPLEQVPWTTAALAPGDIFWTRTCCEERKHWAHRHNHSTEIIKQEGDNYQEPWAVWTRPTVCGQHSATESTSQCHHHPNTRNKRQSSGPDPRQPNPSSGQDAARRIPSTSEIRSGPWEGSKAWPEEVRGKIYCKNYSDLIIYTSVLPTNPG